MQLKKLTLLGFILMIVLSLTVVVGCSSDEGDKQEAIPEEKVESDDSSEGASTVAWSVDTDCSACHEREVASISESTYLASSHASLSCETCHTDVATLEKAHENATVKGAARAALINTTVPEETCTACHDKAEIAGKTKDSTVLTDTNGLVVNPHDVPAIPDHEALDCNSCHQMHVADADLSKKANRVCGSCHHTNTYECYTCHA